MPVPQTGQVPFSAGRPLAIFTCFTFAISRFALHFTQYPSFAAIGFLAAAFFLGLADFFGIGVFSRVGGTWTVSNVAAEYSRRGPVV